MKDAKSRGAAGAKSAREKKMAELAVTAKRLGAGSWASEQLKLMKAGSSFKRAEMIVQGKAEAAMDAEAKKRNKPRPPSLQSGGRFRESYGPLRPVGNPGAGVFGRSRTSDYIRPPLTMKKSNKKK